ncbi:MAG: hypothetical protein KIT63_23820 [Rhodoferax sp.]|nr:hypothetical protein [Rhodoferax sp.]
MAKIPMGDFGQLVPQAGRTPTAGSVDGGLSRAVQDLGNTAINIGADRMRAEEHARQTADLERKRMADRERQRVERELEKAQELRERTVATTATKSIGVDAADLSDDISRRIATGEIKPAQAGQEFDKLSEKMLQDRLKGINPEMAKFIRANTIDNVGSARNRTIDAATAHIRHGVRAELVATGEAFERAAMMDRDSSVRQYTAMLQTLGPQAGMTPEQVQRDVQSFREKTAYNLGDALVRAARDDPKALDTVAADIRGEAFADLSPDKLGQLDTRIANRRQLIEAKRQTAIARGEAAAARRDRQAESAVRALQTMVDNGSVPDDNMMRTITTQVAGTPYATEARELLVGAAKAASFAQLPPASQERAIIEMRTRLTEQGSNPALERRIERFASIKARTEKQLAEDPLMYGVNARLIEIAPLNFTSLDQLAQQIGQRAEAAHTVAARTGVPTSPLLASEAHRAGEMLRALPLAQKNTVVRQLATVMDPSMVAALGRQIDGKDNVLGSAIFAAATMPPAVSELILQGADATASGRVKDDSLSSAAAVQIARELDKVPWPTTSARDSAVAAAQRVYAGLRDRNGSASASEAVRHVTNGLADWNNGTKVPMPIGYDERRFKREVRAIDAKTMAKFADGFDVLVGGELVGVEKLAQNMDALTLIPAGMGTYALSSGGALVMKRGGGVVRIQIGGK